MNSEGVNEGVLIKIFMWWWIISKMDKKKLNMKRCEVFVMKFV